MPASSKSELDTIALLRKELEAQRLAYEKKLREQAEKLREKDEKLREKDSKLREKDSKIARLEKINLAQGLLVQEGRDNRQNQEDQYCSRSSDRGFGCVIDGSD